MWLLVRMVFWLSVVIALLPVTSSQQETSASQVGAIDALSAASAAVSDIRQFCVRQPAACAAGSQAIVQFGHKAETGAKWLYQFLNGARTGRSSKSIIGSGSVRRSCRHAY